MEEVAAIFLFRNDGAALLQKRDDKPTLRYAGMWGMPGGHADVGESMEACIKRELYEETGYQSGDVHWVAEVKDVFKGWPPYLLTVFWADYDSIQPIQCHEGQEVKFVHRTEAASYQIPTIVLQLWDQAIETAKKWR